MPKRTSITVVLIEEEPFLRSVLVDLIRHQPGYRVVLAAAPDVVAEEAKDLPAPRITVVGVGEGPEAQLRSLRALTWAKEHWSASRMLAITCACGRDLLMRTAGLGVRGYIQRGTHSSADFLRALDDLVTDGHAIPTDVVFAIARLNEPTEDDRIEAELTLMQKKVLDGICAPDNPTWGLVAKRLFKHPKTVGTHAAALFATLNMHDKEAVKAWGRARGYGLGKWCGC